MHVCFLSEHYHKNPSGPRKAAFHIAQELVAMGHEASLVSISPRSRNDRDWPGRNPARLRRYWWKIVPVRHGRHRFYARELAKVHRKRPIDVVLAMGLAPGYAALEFRGRHGVPFVLNPRSLMNDGPGSKFDRAVELIRACDAFAAPSESAACDWCRVLGYARDEKIFGILNGCVPGEFEGEAEPPQGLETGREPLLLSMAQLRKVKGHHLLVRALAEVKDLAWTTAIAGKGDFHEEIEREIAEAGLADRVRLVGEVHGPQWRWLYRNAAVFCMLPVYPESGANALVEAQAAGLPVVTTDQGSNPEIVLDGQTGLVIPLGSADKNHVDPAVPGVAAALRRLLTDRDLRVELGEAGRARAKELSWRRSAEKYLEAFSCARNRRGESQ